MRRRLLSEQRGAISVLAALSLVFVVISAAMTVDIGQATWQKRSLQRLADVVSLDAVRALGDRKDPLTDTYTKVLQFAQQSATRNEFSYSDTAHGNSLTVEIGMADVTTKTFTPVAPSDYGIANAVRVTTTHRNDNLFMPGSIPVTTQAVSMVSPESTFSIGSRLIRVNSTTSPLLNAVLKGMLGSAVNLDLVSYNGLADATVGFGAVWTNLGLGTPSQILNTQVTVKNFLTAAASALNAQGDGASLAAATTLGTLATQVDPSLKFKFGDMLALASGDPGAAATAKLDVLEMVGMAAELANGTNLLNLTLPINIPGVATVTMKLSLIEKPKIASGPAAKNGAGQWVTQAHTAQLRAQLDLTLLQKLNLLLKQGTVHIPIYLEAAGADGALTNVQCAIPASNSQITVHTVTKTVTAKIGTASDASLVNPGVPADVVDALIVSIPNLVSVTGHATASVPGTTTDLLIPLLQVRSAGTQTVSLQTQLLSTLSLTVNVLGLGINVGSVLNTVTGILTPVLNLLDSALFNPLKAALAALGIEIGGADVSNLATSCGHRKLIG